MGRRRQQGGNSRSSTKRRRGFRPRRKKVCYFCTNMGIVIDYKDFDLMRRYISDRGKIMPRRRTGTCPRHQRDLARHIKKAREIALLPYTSD